jgi:hypothetical protein
MKRFLKKAKFEYLEGDEWDLVNYCSVSHDFKLLADLLFSLISVCLQIKVEAVPAFKNLKGKCIPTYIFFGVSSLAG